MRLLIAQYTIISNDYFLLIVRCIWLCELNRVVGDEFIQTYTRNEEAPYLYVVSNLVRCWWCYSINGTPQRTIAASTSRLL